MKLIKICPFCFSDFESEGTPDTISTELLVMRAFLREFNPILSTEVEQMNYGELKLAIKETAELL